MIIPIFPLSNCLFPGGSISLMIFEIRYLKMVENVWNRKGVFGVIMLESGSETLSPRVSEQIRNIGTTAKITQLEKLQPSLFSIKCQGVDKFKLRRAKKEKYGLWVGDIDELESDEGKKIPSSLAMASNELKKIIHTKPYAGLTKQSNKIDDCGWVANRWAELLPITAQDRQKLLEELEPIERLKKIIRLLSEYGVS